MKVYRIETPRTVLRCPSPEEAELVKRAEDESREHLRTFMVWAARGPETLDEVVAKLRLFRSRFDHDEDFYFGAFDRSSGTMVGGTGLHPRVGKGGIETGYWIHPAWLRRGLATEIAAAVTRVAFEVEHMRWVEIRCARANLVSARIPPKLGFSHEATLRERIELPDGSFDDAEVFTLLARDYEASAAKKAAIAAFDAVGQRLA